MWELEAGRRPFADVSHPLAYLGAMWDADRRYLRNRLDEDPPGAIVLDGYTERIYLRWLPEMTRALLTAYRKAETIRGSRYPVRVYLRARGPTTGGDPSAIHETGPSTAP